MAQAVFNIKQNDTKPYLRSTLKDANGNAVVVTGCTITFSMRLDFSQPCKVDGQSCIIVDGANGIIEYRFAEGDTDTPGEYRGEFTVTYADDSVETFPNDGFIKIYVLRSL